MANASARFVLDRVDAVSRFLNSLAGSASLEAAKPLQIQGLLNAINGLAILSVCDAATLNEKMGQLPVSASDKEKLVLAVVCKCSEQTAQTSTANSARRSLQDFATVNNYLHPALLTTLLNADLAPSMRLEQLLLHCSYLGLQNPSEGTMQVVAAIYMLCCERDFNAMSPAARMQTYKAIKAEFKRLSGLMPNPVVYLQKLPSDPIVFKDLAPEAWERAFQQTLPQASHFSMATLQHAIACIPMRTSRADSSLNRASSSQQPASDIGMMGLGSVIQQFALGMQQQMQQMQQTQHQLLNAFAGGAASSAPSQPMLQDAAVATSENRFLKKAQSRLQLMDFQSVNTPAKSENSLLAAADSPEVDSSVRPAAAAPAEVAETPGLEPKRKSVEEASALILTAMRLKAEAAKTAKDKEKEKENQSQPQAKVNAKSAAKVAAAPKSVAKTKKVKKEELKPKQEMTNRKKPRFSDESSRRQYMGRTGKTGPGQSVAFKYDPSKKGDKEAAKLKAEKWLKNELKTF